MKKDHIKALVFVGILLLLENNAFAWTSHSSKDKMTGEVSAYATSSFIKPLEDMSFPYQGTKSWIGFGCDKTGSEWAYIGFNKRPNLKNSKTRDGYNLVTERVKWDDTVISTQFIQSWGAKSLHFYDAPKAIQNISVRSSMLLELHWYGEKEVYFQHSLEGSSKAIEDARSICRK